MLCSSCSCKLRPVVALDIDGTLGQYHRHLASFAKRYLGVTMMGWGDPTVYQGDEPYRDWFCRRFGVTLDVFRDIKLAYRQGGLKRSMEVYPYAAELTISLRNAGAEIWITTTRPYQRLDNVDPDTRFWLDHNGFVYDYMIYGEDKYEVLAERVDPARVVAVLDDLPEQYESAQSLFGDKVPIFRQNLFNEKAMMEPPRRTSSDINEITNMILQDIKNWRTQNA